MTPNLWRLCLSRPSEWERPSRCRPQGWHWGWGAEQISLASPRPGRQPQHLHQWGSRGDARRSGEGEGCCVCASQHRGWVGGSSGGLSPGGCRDGCCWQPPAPAPGCWGWGRCFVLSGCLILLCPVFISLHLWALPCQGISFSPPCLHQAHNVQEPYIFLVSLFQAWIFSSPLPVLLCQGRVSFSCLLLRVCKHPHRLLPGGCSGKSC